MNNYHNDNIYVTKCGASFTMQATAKVGGPSQPDGGLSFGTTYLYVHFLDDPADRWHKIGRSSIYIMKTCLIWTKYYMIFNVGSCEAYRKLHELLGRFELKSCGPPEWVTS